MTAAIFTIGTELTRGELHDRNGGDIAGRLTDRGYEVTEISTGDDDDERIVATLRRLAESHDFVICTGGLGPTTDDRTSACAAQALGVELKRHTRSYEELRLRMESRGRVMTRASEKQADFPEGAIVLPNPRGTAPGFSITLNGCALFFTPGVPLEMDLMFEQEIVPRLPKPPRPTVCHRLRTYGLPEVQVNDRLIGVEDEFRITIGYRASNSEIEVKVIALGEIDESEDSLIKRAAEAKERVASLLGAIVYAEGTTSMSAAVGHLLRDRGLKFGVAESCTGGLVSQLMTSVPGASEYYFGGVCSYDNSIKEGLLGVSADELRISGAVSEAVARQMAEGARRALGVDVSLSLTGIAGPTGGTDDKPVGLVHFAVSTPHETRAFHRVFRGTREQIQRRAAIAGLWEVRAALLDLPASR